MKKIKLTQGKYALVDDSDFEELNKHKWYTLKTKNTFYVARKNKDKCILMHREIMQTPKGLETDHMDGNGLNNQRSNLRVCTHKENIRNSKILKNNVSGYKGVSWHEQKNKWRAVISVNKKHIHLGHFSTKEQAYKAYCKACIKYHGKFANFG